MNSILSIMTSRSRERILQEDEYLDENNGLAYCRKCQTPRQAMIPIGNTGQYFFPSIMCKCQREKAEQEDAAREERHKQYRIEQLRRACFSNYHLLEHTFENSQTNDSPIQTARNYADHFEEFEAKGQGLLLYGPVDTGKTYIAACVANALLNRSISVYMTNFSRVLNSLTLISNDKNAYLDSMNRYRLVVIDDLGIERNSEFALEQIFSFIDSRYISKLPMIITTNLDLVSMHSTTDLRYKRIYNRILERCIPIGVNEQSFRHINISHMLEEADSILSIPCDDK